VTDAELLDAGPFSAWLAGMERALEGELDADVPCGSCTGCCTASQFIHIGPEETAALARIPAELLFPAPRAPAGHVLMGYDERGRCPMLVDAACSIYEDRPRTCRTYDCRVFTAAGVAPDADSQPDIAARVDRWRFDHPTERDEAEHAAVRAAAAWAREHPDAQPDGVPVANPTQLAIVAVRRHRAFLPTSG
jgi:Fe-S-cluster containining protein